MLRDLLPMRIARLLDTRFGSREHAGNDRAADFAFCSVALPGLFGKAQFTENDDEANIIFPRLDISPLSYLIWVSATIAPQRPRYTTFCSASFCDLTQPHNSAASQLRDIDCNSHCRHR